MSSVYGPVMDGTVDSTTAAENAFLDYGVPIDAGTVPNATPGEWYDTSGNVMAPPVQASQTGTSLLGWLGLANSVAQTAVAANKSGVPITAKPRTTTATAASNSTVMLLLVGLFAVLILFGVSRK